MYCSSVIFTVQLCIHFCRASFGAQIESFWGTIPWSSAINLLLPSNLLVCLCYTAIGPVHKGPPLWQGRLKARDNKIGAQCGTYGRWQRLSTISEQRVSCCRLTAKSYKKWFLLMRKHQRPYDFAMTNYRLTQAVCHSIARHKKMNWQCAVPSQSAEVCCVLQGSAQLTSGDIGGNIAAQDHFSPRETNPERESVKTFPVSKSGHHW